MLAHLLPRAVLLEIEPALIEMGELAGAELYHLQISDRKLEPTLTQWDAWGNRIDRVEVTPLWRSAERIAAWWASATSSTLSWAATASRPRSYAAPSAVSPRFSRYAVKASE